MDTGKMAIGAAVAAALLGVALSNEKVHKLLKFVRGKKDNLVKGVKEKLSDSVKAIKKTVGKGKAAGIKTAHSGGKKLVHSFAKKAVHNVSRHTAKPKMRAVYVKRNKA